MEPPTQTSNVVVAARQQPVASVLLQEAIECVESLGRHLLIRPAAFSDQALQKIITETSHLIKLEQQPIDDDHDDKEHCKEPVCSDDSAKQTSDLDLLQEEQPETSSSSLVLLTPVDPDSQSAPYTRENIRWLRTHAACAVGLKDTTWFTPTTEEDASESCGSDHMDPHSVPLNWLHNFRRGEIDRLLRQGQLTNAESELACLFSPYEFYTDRATESDALRVIDTFWAEKDVYRDFWLAAPGSLERKMMWQYYVARSNAQREARRVAPETYHTARTPMALVVSAAVHADQVSSIYGDPPVPFIPRAGIEPVGYNNDDAEEEQKHEHGDITSAPLRVGYMSAIPVEHLVRVDRWSKRQEELILKCPYPAVFTHAYGHVLLLPDEPDTLA